MNNQTINRVYNLIILDESGSMEAIRQATINGFNELLQSIKSSIKENPEIEQYVNFYSFNGAGIKEQLPLSHASHLHYLTTDTYRPDHMTPLYDAIGHAVNRLNKALEQQSNYNVLVTILTDGEENASVEYKFKAVSQLIKDMKAKGWVFTYIGANHDVAKTAVSLSINNHLHFNTTEEDTKVMFEKNHSSRKKYMDKIVAGNYNIQSDFFNDEDDKK